MGDILHALPAVTALRKAHPAWRIDWAVEPQWRPLLSAEPAAGESEESESDSDPGACHSIARPVVDRIHPVPAKRWGKGILRPSTFAETLAEIGRLRAELRSCAYDAVLDLQGAVRSAVVCRLTGCLRRIGEDSPREAPARWLFTERVKTVGDHVIDQDVELASAVAGDLLKPERPALPVDMEAEEWCDRLEPLKWAIWTGEPVVLLHPSAGWGAKCWPPERYAAVVAEFAVRGGTVLINAGPGEQALADHVAASAHAGDHAAVVACSLAQLIALTRRVSLVIGGDTGPLHLACALGKPVVGIYGPTDPKRNGPYGTRFRVLRNPESRQDHTRRAEPEAGLLTISPQMVMDAVVDLMLEDREARRRKPQRVPLENREAGPVWETREP